jgi:hypothetical protein
MTKTLTRHQVALRAYKDAWDRCRAMPGCSVLMGPPRSFGDFQVYAAYPAFTPAQIATQAARCNRMFRAMKRYGESR